MTITCYPQPGKATSRVILEAFAEGCGAKVSDRYQIQEGYSAFYGVVGIEPLWRQAKERGFYYLDNAFVDCARGTHYRVAKDRLHDVAGKPDWKRYGEFKLEAKPWRKGRHIVVVMQSEHFMKEVAQWPGGSLGWQAHVLGLIKEVTDRQIIVRHWNRDKKTAARTLAADLATAHLLVAHSSAAANGALMDGVPVYVTDKLCAAYPMSSSSIEHPFYHENREEWAARLCNSMWTLEELREGKCHRARG